MSPYLNVFSLVDTPAYQGVIGAVTSSLSEANLASVLTYAVTASVVFVLFWFSCRKTLSILVRSFARGKLRL